MSSKLYEHAAAFYSALEEGATTELLPDLDDAHALIFRGKITDAFKSTDASQGFYSKIRQALLETGCIKIVQQGARGSQSVVLLHHKPTESEFSEYTTEKINLTKGLDPAILSREVQDLKRLVSGISIPDAFLELQVRIEELENRLRRLEQLPPKPMRKV